MSVPPTLPTPPSPIVPALRRYAVGAGVLVLVVLLQVLSQYLVNPDPQRSLSVLLFLGLELPPLMWTLTVLFERAQRQARGTSYMVAVGLAVAGALGATSGALFWWIAEQLPDLGLRLFSFRPMSAERAALFGFTYGLGHLGLWTLAIALPSALHDARVRALEADKLRLEAERLRAAADLARLRANLEPHFLLNTLNAIAGLISEDVKEARRLLVCLGDLLRDALRDDDELQPLDAQLAWLKRYAEILETRHRGVLQFHWQIEEGLGSVLMPRLLLQPLVENAVKHGALKRSEGGQVSVRVELESEGRVRCTVEDNGPGIASELRPGAFGLQSVRRRLELRYPERSQFRIESSASGTRSIVELPRELAAGGGAA